MKLNFILPFTYALASLALFSVFLANPKMIWALLSVVILISFFNSWSFSGEAKSHKQWWQFAILPLLANFITVAYLTIQSNTYLAWFIVIILTVFNYIYWRYLYFYLNFPSRYQPFSLEYLSFYIDFVLVFFLSTAIFGLRAFLSLNFWLVLIIMAVVLALILIQFNWISKYEGKTSLTYLFGVWFLLMELYIALAYLPLNHNVLGFIWAISYYLLMVIITDKLKGKLNSSRLKIYLGLSFVIVTIIFLSARWL